MIREQLKTNYVSTNDDMKSDFIEWLTICNYMDEKDFNNLFNLKKLNEKDFFSIVDFLWKQECYSILFMLMARHFHRFKHDTWDFPEEMNSNIDSRIIRVSNFEDFNVPKLV